MSRTPHALVIFRNVAAAIDYHRQYIVSYSLPTAVLKLCQVTKETICVITLSSVLEIFWRSFKIILGPILILLAIMYMGNILSLCLSIQIG